MELLPIIYLGYMFTAIYLLTFYFLLYFNNKKDLFSYPETNKNYSISVLVPVWNEEKTIEETVKSIFEVDYPLKEILVINDGSTDKTEEIVKELQKRFSKLKLINKKNTGKGDSLNVGIKEAQGELIAVIDADSYPAKDSFKKLVGFFEEKNVGAVTCPILPRNTNKFFEKIQAVEYSLIAFTRKLLGYVDAIYVVPGPLAIYRTSALKEIGGFDPDNMTEDIEIIWHLTQAGYQRKMCLSTRVTTIIPNKFKPWYLQRRRWNVGGLQCISKYKKNFLKRGMLGSFILPFFTMQLFLGLLGMGIFVYLLVTNLLKNYIFARYSINVGTALLTMNDLQVTASFLNYLGLILFVIGLIFTLLVLSIMKTSPLEKHSFFNLMFFSIFYLSVYPFIMIGSLYSFIRKNYQWR
jgi:biofilm PGA synthesis N-glycosyltransferase PgaC